jgi:hypothetical protein
MQKIYQLAIVKVRYECKDVFKNGLEGVRYYVMYLNIASF